MRGKLAEPLTLVPGEVGDALSHLGGRTGWLSRATKRGDLGAREREPAGRRRDAVHGTQTLVSGMGR